MLSCIIIVIIIYFDIYTYFQKATATYGKQWPICLFKV